MAKEIEKFQGGFLWGKGTGRKGLHLVSWEKAILPKYMGGLGIGSVRMKNTALLSKW